MPRVGREPVGREEDPPHRRDARQRFDGLRPDPCEAESLRVRSLRQTVANAEAALAKLLAHENANNQAQIETLQEQILVFEGELTDAQRALEQCVASATHGIPAGTADPA